MAQGHDISVSVLNVFNGRGVTSMEEAGESARGTPNPTCKLPLSVQNGRSLRFMAQYQF